MVGVQIQRHVKLIKSKLWNFKPTLSSYLCQLAFITLYLFSSYSLGCKLKKGDTIIYNSPNNHWPVKSRQNGMIWSVPARTLVKTKVTVYHRNSCYGPLSVDLKSLKRFPVVYWHILITYSIKRVPGKFTKFKQKRCFISVLVCFTFPVQRFGAEIVQITSQVHSNVH